MFIKELFKSKEDKQSQKDEACAQILNKVMARVNELSESIGDRIKGGLANATNPIVFAKVCGEAMAIPYNLNAAYEFPSEDHVSFSLSSVTIAEQSGVDYLDYRRMHEIATHFIEDHPDIFQYNQQLKVSFFGGRETRSNNKPNDTNYYVVKEQYDIIIGLFDHFKKHRLIKDDKIDKLAFMYLLWDTANKLIDEEIDRHSVVSQEIDIDNGIYNPIKVMLAHGMSYDSIADYLSLSRYRNHIDWQPLLSSPYNAAYIEHIYEQSKAIEEYAQTIEIEEDVQELYDNESDEAYSIEDTDSMTADMFEKLVAALYNKQGYIAKQTQFVGDQGVDVIAEKNQTVVAIQTKCYKDPVGNTAVQEVVAGKALYNATEAIVVTNSTFTSSARRLAEANGVAMCDRYMLKSLLTSFPVTYMDLINVETADRCT